MATWSLFSGETTSQLLFRVYDDEFAYPAKGYGSIDFKRAGPSVMVTYRHDASGVGPVGEAADQ
jgi:hypothetical protein